MFPLFFQLVILSCDYTLDAVNPFANEDYNEFINIKTKQERLLTKIDSYMSKH